MKLHLLHQLFGQWQDLVFGTKHMVDSDTAGDLMKILILVILLSLLSLSRKLDFQRQGTALEDPYASRSSVARYDSLILPGLLETCATIVHTKREIISCDLTLCSLAV